MSAARATDSQPQGGVPPNHRRVVTGHDENGKAVLSMDSVMEFKVRHDVSTQPGHGVILPRTRFPVSHGPPTYGRRIRPPVGTTTIGRTPSVPFEAFLSFVYQTRTGLMARLVPFLGWA